MKCSRISMSGRLEDIRHNAILMDVLDWVSRGSSSVGNSNLSNSYIMGL